MSNCCETTNRKAKLDCPGCSRSANPVAYQTVLHHLRHPENLKLEDGLFYFCDSTNCDTAYFDNNNNVFSTSQVRGIIGQKSNSPTRPICYCFDITAEKITKEIIENGISSSKNKVIKLTKAKLCSCEIRNPSGTCCLSDFKPFESYQSP